MRQGYDEPGISGRSCLLLIGCGVLAVAFLVAFGAMMSTWWIYR
jgi:hypothetical protein